MIRSNLRDKPTTAIPKTVAAAAPVNNTNKKAIIKNCSPFTSCISEVYNARVDDAQNMDIVIPIYNLIEYSDVYSKTAGSLWQYYRDEPSLDNNSNIIDFPSNENSSISFKFKQQIIAKTENDGTKHVEIMGPLKCLSNFSRTIEMPLTNCENSLQLKWSKNCILVAGTAENQKAEFKVTDTKLYV